MPKQNTDRLTRREREIMNAIFAQGNRASAEDIRTQVGDAVGNVEIHAGDKAHHCDQSGDGQNYAEEGKKAAGVAGLFR